MFHTNVTKNKKAFMNCRHIDMQDIQWAYNIKSTILITGKETQERQKHNAWEIHIQRIVILAGGHDILKLFEFKINKQIKENKQTRFSVSSHLTENKSLWFIHLVSEITKWSNHKTKLSIIAATNG